MSENEGDSELRLCWLLNEPYHKVQAFWDALATPSNRTRRSRTSIVRVCNLTCKKMEAAGWINIANLDQEENNIIPQDARSILDMVRAHAINGRNTQGSNPASFQMVLNPFNFLIDHYDSDWVSRQFVPFCVPYVVLKEFSMFFNRVAFDRDFFSRAHIAYLTEQSLRWMNYRYLSLPYSNSSDRPTFRTGSDNFVSSASGNSSQLLDPEAQCVICIEKILPEQSYVILKCLHPFHASCIRNWKREKNFEARCPSCRRYIITVFQHHQY